MKKKYIIRLAAEERQKLTDLVRKGKAAAYRHTHAQILKKVREPWSNDTSTLPGAADESAPIDSD